jgi:hypothetical protein
MKCFSPSWEPCGLSPSLHGLLQRNVQWQAGNGQPIDFIATDILRVRDGKATNNWHTEDNLTFLKEGVVPRNWPNFIPRVTIGDTAPRQILA